MIVQGHGETRRHLRGRGSEATFIVAIALAHLVIAILLVRALAQSGLIERRSTLLMVSRSIPSDDVVPTLTPPKLTEIVIDASVPEPLFDVDARTSEVPEKELTDAHDPYAGATSNRASHDDFVGEPVVSAAAAPSFEPSSAATQEFNRTGSAIRSAWITELRERLKPLLSHLTSALRPAQIEVLAQPFGGFSAARLKQSSGNTAVDSEILSSVMRYQNLVGGNTVAQTKWVTLEDISII